MSSRTRWGFIAPRVYSDAAVARLTAHSVEQIRGYRELGWIGADPAPGSALTERDLLLVQRVRIARQRGLGLEEVQMLVGDMERRAEW